MRILVTGGTGFIGTPTVLALSAAGHDVVLATRDVAAAERRFAATAGPVTFAAVDLLCLNELERLVDSIHPDAALLASWCAQPPDYTRSPANVDFLVSTLTLARLLLSRGCKRIVGVGTCAEYDTNQGYLSETCTLLPRSLYAATKAGAFSILDRLCADAGAQFAWARVFFQYGPFEHDTRLVASTICALLRGQRARLTPGDQVRDFLHVDDVGRAIAAVMESGTVGPVNVASGVPVTVREVALAVGRACDRLELLSFGARPFNPADPGFICGDAGRLKGLGWRLTVPLEDGIAQTVDWWRQRLP